MERRRSHLLGATAAMVLALAAGCAKSREPVEMFDGQKFEDASVGATFELRVISVEEQDPAAFPQLSARTMVRTPVFVTYLLSRVDVGEPVPLPLSYGESEWDMRYSDGEAVQRILLGVVDTCEQPDDADYARVAAGGSVLGCAVFSSDGRPLARVNYRDMGWLVGDRS